MIGIKIATTNVFIIVITVKSLQNIQETSYRTLENIETITITYKCKCHHAIMISFKINEKLGECDKGHQCSIHQMLLFAYQMIAKVS